MKKKLNKMSNEEDKKEKSLFQERLVCLFLRLNGYLQSGYIPHSGIWGNAGTDIDRIAVRFPNHKQPERQVEFSPLIGNPENFIDIIIAEVKNNSLKFNDALIKEENRAKQNWGQLLRWTGIFEDNEIDALTPNLMTVVSKHGLKKEGVFDSIFYESKLGFVKIRPTLFSIEKAKRESETKFWINGAEILDYIWECLSPKVQRIECSTRYDYKLWGYEYMDIVEYIKNRSKNNKGIGSLNEMYNELKT